jgi:hypothetical protein
VPIGVLIELLPVSIAVRQEMVLSTSDGTTPSSSSSTHYKRPLRPWSPATAYSELSPYEKQRARDKAQQAIKANKAKIKAKSKAHRSSNSTTPTFDVTLNHKAKSLSNSMTRRERTNDAATTSQQAEQAAAAKAMQQQEEQQITIVDADNDWDEDDDEVIAIDDGTLFKVSSERESK